VENFPKVVAKLECHMNKVRHTITQVYPNYDPRNSEPSTDLEMCYITIC